MAFTMKQNDTRPNLPVQFFQADGTTPLDLTTATSVSIVIRQKGQQAVKLKRAITITDAAGGEGEFDWQTGDTDTVGDFEYEFEILWNNGDIQTVPAFGYLELSIIDDIG